MASSAVLLREIKRSAFEEDLFTNVRFSGRPSIRDLVMSLLERPLRPQLATALQHFLQFLNELHDLFQRMKDVSGELFGVESTLGFMKDDPPEEKIWLYEELIRLQAQMRRLDEEMCQKRNQCNAMRNNPPF